MSKMGAFNYNPMQLLELLVRIIVVVISPVLIPFFFLMGVTTHYDNKILGLLFVFFLVVIPAWAFYCAFKPKVAMIKIEEYGLSKFFFYVPLYLTAIGYVVFVLDVVWRLYIDK